MLSNPLNYSNTMCLFLQTSMWVLMFSLFIVCIIRLHYMHNQISVIENRMTTFHLTCIKLSFVSSYIIYVSTVLETFSADIRKMPIKELLASINIPGLWEW